MSLKTLSTTNILAFIIIALTMGSCVTARKYDALMAEKVGLQGELQQCDDDLTQAKADLAILQEQVKELQESTNRLIQDSTQTGMVLRKTKMLYDDLNNTYERLLKNHNRLLSNSAAESDKLSKDLTQRSKDLLKIETDLQESRREIDKLSADVAAREARVQELEKVLAEKDSAVNQLRNKVQNALLNFKEKDLSIEIKNGKVYVSLAEQLLFGSGSYKVDEKGKDALAKLSEVLKQNNDVNVMVEGHTDDVPVAPNTNCLEDNWDLSVLRATAIAKILMKEGVEPTNITAAGRGETQPLEVGKTREIRSRNRRTEIILTPNLDELFQILESN